MKTTKDSKKDDGKLSDFQKENSPTKGLQHHKSPLVRYKGKRVIRMGRNKQKIKNAMK